MHVLKELAFAACCLCVVIAVIEMLLPEGSFRAPMKLITGAVLLLTLFSPFLGDRQFALPDFQFETSDAQAIADEIAQQSARAAAQAVGGELRVLMEQIGISGQVQIIVDIRADNCIDMKQAVVKPDVPDSLKAQRLTAAAKEQMGLDVVVEQ